MFNKEDKSDENINEDIIEKKASSNQNKTDKITSDNFKDWFWIGCKDKTSWEWMELLIAPLIVAGTGASLALIFSLIQSYHQSKLVALQKKNDDESAALQKEYDTELAAQQKKNDTELAKDKYREETLKKYFDDMTQLFNDNKTLLSNKNPNDINWVIAQSRTLITLRQLDGRRKGLLVSFLSEAKLINQAPELKTIIKLEGADLNSAQLQNINLRNINLNKANLIQADLEGANLGGAQLKNAKLTGIKLQNTSLEHVDLTKAKVDSANLQKANLTGANLTGANLQKANLTGANLQKTNISEANISTAQLYGVKDLTNTQIKSACYWEKAIYTEAIAIQDSKTGTKTKTWIVKDEEANKQKIDEIKKDKVSDPQKPPNCKN